MDNQTVIINYGMGNIFSVRKVIERLGFSCKISSSYEDIQKAGRIILPGVGHFGKVMQNLQEAHLIETLQEAVQVKKIPVLGICLGMQLMAAHSEEGDVAGLGWFDANVIKFRINNPSIYKVPHMGWNTLTHEQPDSPTLKNLNIEEGFYFVHSYHIVPNHATDILSHTSYEYLFVSALEKENITGVQFHPEKSHRAGEQLIKNFLKK
jgi:glutamine amidotransferase